MKAVTAAQMRRIDEKAIRHYGIPSLILMENAGAACAREAIKLIVDRLKKAVILCGKGNNGGDGFVAARHLLNRGVKATIFFFQKPSEMKPDPLVNFNILKKLKADLINSSIKMDPEKLKKTLRDSDLVIDALFGTGVDRILKSPFRQAIEIVNTSKRPVLSIDVPSGLNADTGRVMGDCIRAKLTVTLGIPKRGFYMPGARSFTGKVIVADISLPARLLKGK
jgi:NAD(P)H-hydrate epimerase